MHSTSSYFCKPKSPITMSTTRKGFIPHNTEKATLWACSLLSEWMAEWNKIAKVHWWFWRTWYWCSVGVKLESWDIVGHITNSTTICHNYILLHVGLQALHDLWLQSCLGATRAAASTAAKPWSHAPLRRPSSNATVSSHKSCNYAAHPGAITQTTRLGASTPSSDSPLWLWQQHRRPIGVEDIRLFDISV